MEFSTTERLVALLEDWAKWQASYRQNLGFPSRSLSCYGDGVTDFDGMCDQVDSATFRTIDAVVNDPLVLLPPERAAIMRRYGVATVFPAVFRTRESAYEVMLQSAHEKLCNVLPKRNVLI